MKQLALLAALTVATTLIFSCTHTIRKSICEENPYSIDCGCLKFFDAEFAKKDLSLDRLQEIIYCDKLYYTRPVNGIKEILDSIYRIRPEGA